MSGPEDKWINMAIKKSFGKSQDPDCPCEMAGRCRLLSMCDPPERIHRVDGVSVNACALRGNRAWGSSFLQTYVMKSSNRTIEVP